MAELITTEPEKWFKFDVDTEVLLRLFTKQRLKKITEVSRKKANLTGRSADELFDEALAAQAVLGWRNMNDHGHPGFTMGGQPFPFTPDNLKALMNNLKFSRFVSDRCVDQDEFVSDEPSDEELLDAEKNG